VILESGERLSRSRLWRLQRKYFEQAGVAAWGSATVPHYITCNAFIAESYAKVVLGWMRDCAAAGIDDKEPLQIVELGAGSGRFAYLFLKKLEALLGRSPLAPLRFRYVMTDFTDDSLDFWRGHPTFRRFVEAGQLDFARFDVERDSTLHLVESGDTIEQTVNPMAVLANYYFDSIPQDAFYVCEGQLYECLSTLTLPEDGHDVEDPLILQRLELTYEDRLVDGSYYQDEELDRILAGYRGRVKKGAVKFPTGGLHCCRVFSQMSRDRWLLVTGDKGQVHEDTLDGQKRPGMAIHGSFSMNVNYHALGEFFNGRGGQHFTMDHHHNSLNVVTFTMGAPHLETYAAFADAVECFSPDDYFIVRKALDAETDDMKLEQALSLLRLGRNDPRLLRTLLPVLRKHGPKAPAATKREILHIVDRAWDLYFHIGEEHDLAFAAGVLVFELGAYDRCIELFHASITDYGIDAGTAYNLALAHNRLKRREEALKWAREALTAEPAHVAARKLRDDLEIALSPEPG
jgi:tetratricopeptide (TPR) repeat protein